jgi:hypothetical protein
MSFREPLIKQFEAIKHLTLEILGTIKNYNIKTEQYTHSHYVLPYKKFVYESNMIVYTKNTDQYISLRLLLANAEAFSAIERHFLTKESSYNKMCN